MAASTRWRKRGFPRQKWKVESPGQVAIACRLHEDNRREVAVASALGPLAHNLQFACFAYLPPLEGGTWWGSTSGSPGTPYLDTGFPETGPLNGGRNSSIFSPDMDGGCRGEEVADADAPGFTSLIAPVWGRGFSGFWSTG